MADVNSTFKVYISTDPVFKVYVNNGAKGDSGIDGIDGQNGEGVASGGFTGQFLIKLSEEDFDTGWSNIDSTQVSYGDGTVSEGLDNRYTKGETDLLLSGKSNTSHTHDDRYFTETEVGVLLSGKSDTSHTHDGRYYTETETDALLSGKSDTTHNHDLTYAPIVHNHDDLYYTDDEVDTLLLSKSDTTHTHDDRYYTETETNTLLATKADKLNATNIVTNGDFSNGTTGWLAHYSITGLAASNNELSFTAAQATAGVYKTFSVTNGNKYYISASVKSDTSSVTVSYSGVNPVAHSGNNTHQRLSTIYTSTYTSSSFGIMIRDNRSSAWTTVYVKYAIVIDLTATFGVGNEPTATEMDTLLAKFPNSWFNGTNYIADLSEITKLGNSGIQNATEANAKIEASSTGAVITRNVNDANPALKVNQANASSTGSIQDWQFGGSQKATLNKDGRLGLTTGIVALSSANDCFVQFTTNGTIISRNQADAQTALRVNQQNASSTGNIAEFQFNGTTKLAIDKNGLVPATNIANTPAGNISATTVQGAINELDTEKADKLFATNLVTNGDFSNGTTGWSANGGALSVASNVLSHTASGTLVEPSAVQNYAFVSGRKYFIKALARVTNASCLTLKITLQGASLDVVQSYSNPSINTWYSFSSVYTTSGDETSVRFYHSYADGATATGKVMEVKYVLVADLTAIFGAGKEPSAIQMDNMLSTFPNSWFNGTAELVSIANLAQLKADKTQEAWITPTLMNGWTVRSGNTIKYRKNNFGSVIVQGEIVPGSATAFILPVGYRPSHNMVFVCPTSGGGLVTFSVNSDGGFTHNTGTLGTYVDLSSIEFYVA